MIAALLTASLLVSGSLIPSRLMPDQTPVPVGGATAISMNDDVQIVWGTGSDVACEYDTAVTPDSMVCGVGADSRIWYLVEKADINTDWGRAQQTNPTLHIHSADATDLADYGELSHDQTNGFQIVSGGGDIILNSAAQINLADSVVVGSATEAPLGSSKLHIFVAESSSAVAGNADDFVIESNTAVGLSLLATASDAGYIYVGNSGNTDEGRLAYDMGINTWTFTANDATVLTISSSAITPTQDYPVLFDAAGAKILVETVSAPDTLVIGTNTTSNAIVIGEGGDVTGVDLNPAAGAATNPTVYIHSADEADANDWISFAMDQTNGVIDVGQGAVQLPDALIVGTATDAKAVTGILSETATLDFPLCAATATADLTITVTGAATASTPACSVGQPASAAADSVFTCWVSAADTVTVRHHCAASVDPASATYRVTVFQY